MPTHLTARLAWHDDGWNGAVCRRPERNTYCVGLKSYPGDVIARTRDLTLEQRFAGCGGAELDGRYVPPCCYSYNAFGAGDAPARVDPPAFFYGGAAPHEWTLPRATACAWSYDAMYDDNVKASGRLDNDQRRANVRAFFAEIEGDRAGRRGESLIFYYCNTSNPLSEEDAPRYLLVGVSRIVRVGDELRYENVSDAVAERYAGGMIWARNVTSAYPDEGVRLPYHRYRDRPDLLGELALYPERAELCQMGSRHLGDDDAIGLLEQFLARLGWLSEIGDESENWAAQADWVRARIARLWTTRGLYPGLLAVLDATGATALVEATKTIGEGEGHETAHRLAFAALASEGANTVSSRVPAAELARAVRRWRLLEPGAQRLLRDVLPRFALSAETVAAIVGDRAADHGLEIDAAAIAEDPYLLSELFVGGDPGDRIPWSTIDRGVFPAPDLGPPYAGLELDDPRRLRALCVEHLRNEPNHAFRFGDELLAEIGARVARLPEWKQAGFSLRHFEVDADVLSEALTLRPSERGLTVALRAVAEDERLVERTLRDLASRPLVTLRRPVTATDWHGWIFRGEGALATTPAYAEAVAEQTAVCERLLPRPLAVVTGPAGTGKTTVIEALIRAVRRTEGDGASLLVIAPTGKATDRIREVFEARGLSGVRTSTVHSLLAAKGWLRGNLTFRRAGGAREEVGTVILDESSMLDLELAAALARAIDWRHVRRLILVGDPAQLPPIGRGRVFADTIDWLRREGDDGLGRLCINLRQMRGRAEGAGDAIVRLSQLFLPAADGAITPAGPDDASSEGATTPDQEALIEALHAGGRIGDDLDVLFWSTPEELPALLVDAVERKIGAAGLDERGASARWREVLRAEPTGHQVLTPHRGQEHGVEALNVLIQRRVSRWIVDRVGEVDGITVSDKVIQVRNRPRSNPIFAYDFKQRALAPVEVWNGEIGIVEPHGFDRADVTKRFKTGHGKRLSRFAVKFARKGERAVAYGKHVPALGKGGRSSSRTESVEDNLELAYAISIHKAQGSEFANTFVVVPASAARPLSPELVYTALTRASGHCTLLVERGVDALLEARRRENSQAAQVNSWLFAFRAVAPEFAARRDWYAAGKIHRALSGDMVRSKSEVIIANLLHDRDVPFTYETMLLAPDGTMSLPDFTVTWGGETYFWEHLGLLDRADYRARWAAKQAWYERWFPGRLLTTEECADLSGQARRIIDALQR